MGACKSSTSVELRYFEPERFNISIKTLNGKEVTLEDVDGTLLIKQVKRFYETHSGIPFVN
jgi:hypothetical protein